MSTRSSLPVIATVVIGVILIMGIVGYGYYRTSSSLNSLSEQNSGLDQQLSDLSQQYTTLGQQDAQLSQQNSQLSQQLSNANQQIQGLTQQVSTLQQRTLTLATITSTIVEIVPQTSLVTTIQTSLLTTTQTSLITTTVTSITAVPQAALVVTGDTYNNATHTFTFQVQNTQNYVVYAQLVASLWGQTSFGCNGQAGTFVSQVYTFSPGATTATQLNLGLGTYAGFCGGNPLTSLQMNFVVPQSTAISPTYTFIVVPNYTFP